MGDVRRFDRAVVAGYGELPVRVRGEFRTIDLLGEAVHAALEHAGVGVRDVDGLALGGFTLAPDHAVHVARRLGLRVDWLAPQDPGGVGGVSALLDAARAVESGDAATVVCVGGDAMDRTALGDLMSRFSSFTRDWLAPIGADPANVTFALLADSYMGRHGIDRTAIGRVSVLQRAHGSANPLAVFREPIDLDDYLEAPPVATPLHLLDCVRPGSGATAVVVRRDESGARLPRIVAGAERHGHADAWPPRALGWETFADELFATAAIERVDVDVLELYDDYPFMVLWQLEELGFCEPGQGAAFVGSGNLGLSSAPALNTGGGMLACGQAGAAGGYVPVVEAVRQLFGEGGERQVPDARRALVSGLGMVDYGAPLSVGALILEAS